MSETIITLGIIGVIASITIPNIISEQEKSSTVVKYKKIYSTLTNAVKQSETDNGQIDNWDFSYTPYDNPNTNLVWMRTYILPYLNVSKACNGTDHTKCFAEYIKAPNGNTLSMTPDLDNHFLKYVLSDGSTVAFIFRGAEPQPLIEVLADINGLKNPNTMGKDIFDFAIVTNKTATRYKTGGIYARGWLLNIETDGYSNYGCGKDVLDPNFAGAFCGMKIIRDGYQIKDDYPW